jgi:quinol monooxygenase YgiN
MRYSFRSVFTLLVLAFAMTQFSYAQNDSPVFAVAYIEVTPSSTEQAMSLLKVHAEGSRAQDGNLRFQVLQRIGRPNHFAILDAWESHQLQDEHAAATKGFRDELDAMLYSPYDERRSTPTLGTLAAGDDGEVYVLTHVDIAPRGVEQGLELLEALITASRQEAGAKDIGLIVQDNRQNHMTLFEVWSSAATHEAHITSKHAMRARRELQARIGSLYDERLYRRF